MPFIAGITYQFFFFLAYAAEILINNRIRNRINRLISFRPFVKFIFVLDHFEPRLPSLKRISQIFFLRFFHDFGKTTVVIFVHEHSAGGERGAITEQILSFGDAANSPASISLYWIV